jgi:hypothetical protein
MMELTPEQLQATARLKDALTDMYDSGLALMLFVRLWKRLFLRFATKWLAGFLTAVGRGTQTPTTSKVREGLLGWRRHR